MRPIDKGASPYVSIRHYSEAQPYLKDRIGLYCSYCGFEISHVPEIEHVAAKSKGGSETAWNNLLLGCKYCNTRKGTTVTPANVNDYLWPDQYNTAIAFPCINEIPVIDKAKLDLIDPSGTAYQKAERLFNVVGLGNRPKTKLEDLRFWKRSEVYQCAVRAAKRWKSNPTEELKESTVELAKAMGFFSIWMSVFDDVPEMLLAFLDAFPGTKRTYYDADGHPLPIL